MIIPVGSANWITEYHFTGDAEAMITTCGLRVSTWGGDYAAGLEQVADYWFVALQGSMSEEVTIGPSFLQVGQDGGPPVTYIDTDADNGNAPDFPMWPNSSLLVRKTTASGGRRNRGRMYIPGLAIRDLVSPAGQVDSSFLADFQTNLDTFQSTLEAGTGLPGVTDLVLLHSEAPTAATTIVSLSAQTMLATQRRRLRP